MDSTTLGSAILGSPMVTIQTEVTMVTVPVAMVTAWLPWKYRGVLHQGAKLRSRDT